MDESQPPGDIAHTSALNDRKLLAPLSNYLYRFVSVHLLAVFGQVVSSHSMAEILHRDAASLFLQTSNSQVLFWKASNISFPLEHAAVWRCQGRKEKGRRGRRKDWETKGYRSLVNRKGHWLNIKSCFDKITERSLFSWSFFILLSFTLVCYELWMLQTMRELWKLCP